MDVKKNLSDIVTDVCEKERFNSNLLSRASPMKEIWNGWRERLISFLNKNEGTIFILEDNGNSKKYPKEKKDKVAKNIVICFVGMLKDYLKYIEKTYPEDIWKIQTN